MSIRLVRAVSEAVETFKAATAVEATDTMAGTSLRDVLPEILTLILEKLPDLQRGVTLARNHTRGGNNRSQICKFLCIKNPDAICKQAFSTLWATSLDGQYRSNSIKGKETSLGYIYRQTPNGPTSNRKVWVLDQLARPLVATTWFVLVSYVNYVWIKELGSVWGLSTTRALWLGGWDTAAAMIRWHGERLEDVYLKIICWKAYHCYDKEGWRRGVIASRTR